MSSQISGCTNTNDAFKNDFQNARKRNLHLWMRWRSEVNDQLATSVFTGKHQVNIEPLDAYLHKTDHPSENPKTLLTYSASVDNISSLGVKRFLHYGIPRAKTVKKPFSFFRLRSKKKNASSIFNAEPLLETDEIENVDNNYQLSKENIPPVDDLISFEDENANPTYRDISEPKNGYIIPYYEPEPDYDVPGSPLSPDSPRPGSSITSPGTSYAGNDDSSSSESEPEECPYVVRQRQTEMFAAEKARKSIATISRTYSTLDALDPTYVKSSEIKRRKDKTKKKKNEDKEGSWKSFESSVTSKSTESKAKRSPLSNLIRKTSDAFNRFHNNNIKPKSEYAKTPDVVTINEENEPAHYDKRSQTVPQKTTIYDDKEFVDINNLRQAQTYARQKDILRREKEYSKTIDNSKLAHRHGKKSKVKEINPFEDFNRQKERPITSCDNLNSGLYKSATDRRNFMTFSPGSIQDLSSIKQNNKLWRFLRRDKQRTEYSQNSEMRHSSQLSSHFYGGSMDVFASGLMEQIEFTKEPRRLGNYRNPDSKIYASHSMLHTNSFDNWAYH